MSGEFHLEPSTVKGYRDIWKFHGKGKPIATIRVRDFHTAHAQGFLMGLDQSLSHQTHLRIKAFLSGVFSRAKQVGAIIGVNPMDNTKAGGTKKKFRGVAYTLDVIQDMLERLPDPARTACATAAFTGLSASELRGLRWTDYDGRRLTVRQKVWRRHIGQPKTEAREDAVPVIPALRKMSTITARVFRRKNRILFFVVARWDLRSTSTTYRGESLRRFWERSGLVGTAFDAALGRDCFTWGRMRGRCI
jgi:integrase